MNLGDKLLKLRKEAKLSQENVAEILGVTRQTVSNWELNQTTPDLEQAKELSKIYKTSLDELVENDVKTILTEKVSNVEKLSGIIIKILKGIGILILIYIIFIIIAIILFTVVRKESNQSGIKSATLTCSIENNEYVISIGDDKYFECFNCNKEMNTYLKDITDWANIEHSIENVKKYFTDNGGTCD